MLSAKATIAMMIWAMGGFLPFCLYIVMTSHSPFLPGENHLQLHSYVFESQLHVLLRQFITSLKLFLEK